MCGLENIRATVTPKGIGRVMRIFADNSALSAGFSSLSTAKAVVSRRAIEGAVAELQDDTVKGPLEEDRSIKDADAEEAVSDPDRLVNISIPSIAVSLFVEKPYPRELISVHIKGLEMFLHSEKPATTFDFRISDLQIDNFVETVTAAHNKKLILQYLPIKFSRSDMYSHSRFFSISFIFCNRRFAQ